MKFSIWRKNKA